MKRYGHLWEHLTSFDNLYAAYCLARRGKRMRPDVARFMFRAEMELVALQAELRKHAYIPGGYRTFRIYDRKPRLISAAPFRDRVVHHALCNVIAPIFERSFIFDLYSNRVGKGQHRAVRRAQEFAQRFSFVLKGDIKKYFPSLDHALLKTALRRKLKCQETLWLADLIIDHSNPQDPVQDYFPGDTLLTPLQRPKGLPIGNQTSQFFSNVYLDGFDHFVKEHLRVPGYVRYVDDFLLFGSDKPTLWRWKERLEEFLCGLRLRLKPNGVTLFPVRAGVPFLGYRVLPTVILMRRAAILRFRRATRALRQQRRQQHLPLARIRNFICGCMGHFTQATTEHLRAKLLAEAWF